MARHMAAAVITAYQRHLSPRKGFSCAHRRLHGGESCSAYGKRLILKAGVWRGGRALRQRFQECRVASSVLKAERERRSVSRQDEPRRPSRRGSDCADQFCEALVCDLGLSAVTDGCCSLLSAWGIGCGI